MKKFRIILAFIIGAVLAHVSVKAQVSLNRMKTNLNYGWAQRVVPNAQYLDSTFNSMWLRAGNSVNTNTSYIGTTNNRSFYLKANNSPSIKFDSVGRTTIYDKTFIGQTGAVYDSGDSIIFAVSSKGDIQAGNANTFFWVGSNKGNPRIAKVAIGDWWGNYNGSYIALDDSANNINIWSGDVSIGHLWARQIMRSTFHKAGNDDGYKSFYWLDPANIGQMKLDSLGWLKVGKINTMAETAKTRLEVAGGFHISQKPTADAIYNRSFYMDTTLKGLTYYQNAANTNWMTSKTDGTITASDYIYNQEAAWKGYWLGTSSSHALHLFTDGDAGGMPMLTIPCSTCGVIVYPQSTYTSNASLKVNGGGPTYIASFNNGAETPQVTIRQAGATGVVNTRSCVAVGNITATPTATLQVYGTMSVSGTSTLQNGSAIGTATLAGGNSGTIAVTGDDYFVIEIGCAGTAVLSANSTYYFTNVLRESTNGMRGTAGQVIQSIPITCTLVGAAVTTWNASSSTSQTNSSLYFRLNGSDNLITSSLLWDAAAATPKQHNITGLNVAVNANDTYEMKVVMGNLAQPPVNSAVIQVKLFFKR